MMNYLTLLFDAQRKRFGVRACSALVLAFVLASPTVKGQEPTEGPAPGEKFTIVNRVPGVDQPEMFVDDEFIVVLNRDARGRSLDNLPSLRDAIDREGVTRFDRQFPTAKPQPVDGKFWDLTGHFKVKIDAGVDLDTAMDAFARNRNVDHVEKIGIHPTRGCATGTPRTPNDTWFDNPPPTFNFPQWDLWDANGIDADLAWDINTGDETVVVVAMDTGVRYFHKDLGGNDPPGPADNVTDGNVWVNPYEIPNNGIDDEGNGRIDDVVGWDFVTGVTGCSAGEDCSTQDNDPRDFNGHGTHTAGTMAAITNNARGVAGVVGGFGDGTTGSAGDGSKIMCMRIGWATPFGGFVRMDFAAEAMNYVADMKNRGVNVAAVNCSWGSSDTGGFGAAVDNVLAADVMVVHAAGNSGADAPDFLGNKAGVLNVAATDKNGNRASFSNFGAWVDVAAPGVDIISTYHSSSDPANDYVAVISGTSMSAPHVAGVAALLESCDNGLSGPDKFSIMVNNGCLAGSPNIGDILNAKLALDAVPGGCGGCTTDLECDDLNECTDDACVGGVCQNTPVADDTVCSGGVCCAGTCTAALCSADIDCDDGNECTTDTCTDPGLCSAACSNDPVVCPPGESCVNGVCEPDVCNNDGICDPGEDCDNCLNDCFSGSGAVCGNNVCEIGDGEDCLSCPGDCNGKQNGKPANRYCCGGGAGENPVGCADGRCSASGNTCTETPVTPSCCGDGVCEGSENSTNCEVDCGPPPVCGDASCDPGEDQCTCPSDCCAGAPATESACTDGCDNDCDGLTDSDDPDCACGLKGDPCASGSDCCSGKCRGNGTCK